MTPLKDSKDSPGGPMVKLSNAGGVGSIPGREDKIPHASWQKKKKKKQTKTQNRSNIVISSIRTLKMCVC